MNDMTRGYASAYGWFVLGLVICVFSAQISAWSIPAEPHLVITLERKVADGWSSVSPELILEQNDLVRFRIRANFEGYLYVVNHATSGGYTLLFPQAQSADENRIRPNTEYLVPGTDAQFRITGPPGHEVIYWLISPTSLQGTDLSNRAGLFAPPPAKASKPDAQLLPRCNDEIFRARGECIDSSAGPAKVSDQSTLPDILAGHFNEASRDLTFTPQEKSTVVSSAVPLRDPIIYEFRLAHR